MKYLWLPVLVLTLLAAPVARADFQAGLTAYEQGDFKAAMRAWLPLAEAGDPEAQFRVGRLYDVGEGTPPDGKQAVYWYGKAHGQGNRKATYNLGQIYYSGRIVTKNESSAAKYFQIAAESGHVDAQVNFGVFNLLGKGLKQDLIEGYRWLLIAKSRGDQEVGEAVEFFRKYLTEDQVAKARQRAKDWRPTIR
ncbi:MAG: hypothetical protein CMM61_17575 [Rhodospirillaceae bacterium]|nr:hypothetical protein [Rhodospirillaceae bacterium]|tara:strand:+ start:17 stop:595 length:579 start_codon:yes stop_codon:yes gene_type:complete